MFHHKTTSPYRPQANGMVESAVKTQAPAPYPFICRPAILHSTRLPKAIILLRSLVWVAPFSGNWPWEATTENHQIYHPLLWSKPLAAELLTLSWCRRECCRSVLCYKVLKNWFPLLSWMLFQRWWAPVSCLPCVLCTQFPLCSFFLPPVVFPLPHHSYLKKLPSSIATSASKVFQGGYYSALSRLKMFEFLTDERVSDHNERIRSIQIEKKFITQTFRMYNFIIRRTVRN